MNAIAYACAWFLPTLGLAGLACTAPARDLAAPSNHSDPSDPSNSDDVEPVQSGAEMCLGAGHCGPPHQLRCASALAPLADYLLAQCPAQAPLVDAYAQCARTTECPVAASCGSSEVALQQGVQQCGIAEVCAAYNACTGEAVDTCTAGMLDPIAASQYRLCPVVLAEQQALLDCTRNTACESLAACDAQRADLLWALDACAATVGVGIPFLENRQYVGTGSNCPTPLMQCTHVLTACASGRARYTSGPNMFDGNSSTLGDESWNYGLYTELLDLTSALNPSEFLSFTVQPDGVLVDWIDGSLLQRVEGPVDCPL
jgi:hypothetical protein